MNGITHYEYLFLGGGKGGKSLAMDLARAGKRVAIVERGMIGGSCINVACIPSKTLIQAAREAHIRGDRDDSLAREQPAMAKVAARIQNVVDEMVSLNRHAMETSGLELVIGEGRFVGPRRILVRFGDGTERLLEGENVYINTGTVAALPPIKGLAEARPLTHVQALKLDRLPRALIVVGGGYIGLEMAQAFQRLGSQVTIVQDAPRLAMREDEDVGEAIAQALLDDGIQLKLSARIVEVLGRSGETVTLRLGDGTSLEATHLLVATGRKPLTDDIGLDLAGVECDPRGLVKVDDKLKTTADATWAIGEVAGTPMFTHASFDDYRILKAGIEGRNASTKGRTIPYALFIDPELGRIGLNESEAKARGMQVQVARLPMSAVPRARTNGATRGFMKALVDPATQRILGFTMLGSSAGEVTTVVQMAMLGNLPFTAVRDAIIGHPLMAEGLNLLFGTLA